MVLLMETMAVLVTMALVESSPLGHLQDYQQEQKNKDLYAPIVKQENDVKADGSFKNSFETGNGIAVDEVGYMKTVGKGVAQVIQGANSYTAPDGTVIQTVYTADENGYQPQGNHIPTPPPIPEEILKSLELLAKLPSTEDPYQDQQYQDQNQQYQDQDQQYQQQVTQYQANQQYRPNRQYQKNNQRYKKRQNQ